MRLYEQYINETKNDMGLVTDLTFNIPERFNFAYDVVDRLGREQSDALALMWCNVAGEERRFTFGDMMRYSNKAANVFKAHGVKAGDRVMLVLKRHYQFWFAILGLHKIGAVAVPGTNLLVEKDFVYRFKTAGVTAIVCTGDGDVASQVEGAASQESGMRLKMMARGQRDGWLSFDELVEAASDQYTQQPEDVRNNDDVMLMYFTSGTTGFPKIVCHDYTYPLGHIVTAVHVHNGRKGKLHFTIAETGWAKAVWGKLYGQWLAEVPIMVYDFDKFAPSDVLDVISKYKVATFCAPPTMYRFFIKEDLRKFDLSCLEYCTIAGEALNPEVYNQFYEATGVRLMEGFGQTETTMTVFNQCVMQPKPGSMGKPSPAWDVDLVDENCNSVKAGIVGEIVLRVGGKKPTGMFCGYYNDRQRTDSVWHDGLYHTGDVAWRDEDGYLWYVGRTDDLIKSSGYRIGPFEIESVIMEHPAVLECAVTGVPDEVRGQIVKATVVLAKGYEPSDELRKELQDYVKTHTAPYKYPRILEFMTELPKTISGKIRRVELRGEDKKK